MAEINVASIIGAMRTNASGSQLESNIAKLEKAIKSGQLSDKDLKTAKAELAKLENKQNVEAQKKENPLKDKSIFDVAKQQKD